MKSHPDQLPESPNGGSSPLQDKTRSEFKYSSNQTHTEDGMVIQKQQIGSP